jgi:spore maturation protein CgeB
MSLKLFAISSFYYGNLKLFYQSHSEKENISYEDHCNLLLNETTEFAGAYYRSFRKLGIDVTYVIVNDKLLQHKWRTENGARSLNDIKVLSEQVRMAEPDIIWIENLSYTDSSWLQNIRKNVKSIKLIVAYHCSPFRPGYLKRLKYFDFIITCTPGLKDYLENIGHSCYLVYHGFDKDILDRIDKRPGTPENNLIFSGSLSTGPGYHGTRIELIERILHEAIDISLYADFEKQYRIRTKQSLYTLNELFKKFGMEKLLSQVSFMQYGSVKIRNYSEKLLGKRIDPVYGLEMYSLFQNSKIVLNHHADIAGDYAGNMRLFEVTGIGSCLLTDKKSNMNDLFVPDKEVVIYDSIDDCIEKIQWLMNNEKERAEIAVAGQKRTLLLHTVENRCKQILEIINQNI